MLAALLLFAVPLAQADAAPTRIAVPDMQLAGEIDASVGKTMTEVVVTETSKLGGTEVIGASDIQALLGFEEQKQLLGCSEVACMAELGGALGVDLLLVSDLGLVGKSWALNLKLIDTAEAEVRGRVNRVIEGDVDRVLAVLGDATRELLSALAPQPVLPVEPAGPSWPIWTLIGAGGAALTAGMVLEILATGEYDQAGQARDLGTVVLNWGGYEVHPTDARDHFDQAQTLSRAALGVAIGGAVLAAAGVTWLLVRDEPDAQLTIAPAVGPESSGVVLRGSW